VSLPGETLFNDEREKPAKLRRSGKDVAREDLVELRTNSGIRQVAS
jgi:hypothetical protein